MEPLYAISVNGTMTYFTADISEYDYSEIEKIAEKSKRDIDSINNEDVRQKFINTVLSNLNIRLTEIPIKHVFRI